MKNKIITHIVLEGCDGVGKTTIANGLRQKYNWIRTICVRQR